MRQYKVRDPNGSRRVTIWADGPGEPRYLEIPSGSTVWVKMSERGPLAAPCEYRPEGEPVYSAMVSLEDILPAAKTRKRAGEGPSAGDRASGVG